MANLYLISQKENTGYDTYDSAVVVANSEVEAKRIYPEGPDTFWVKTRGWSFNLSGTVVKVGIHDFPWAFRLRSIKVKLLGIAELGLRSGSIVCSSFNAG